MGEKLSRAWSAEETAEHQRARGLEPRAEAVPMDRTAGISSGEDHRPGMESEYAEDDRGDDPTPQEE
jgi:hypothetical protein